MTVRLVENSVNGHDTGRRTRVLHQKQSKYGCRTCKERKVRCDQEVPSCLRCQKAGRECSGYDKLSKSQGTLYHNYMGLQPSFGSPFPPGTHHRMIRLTLDIFTSDPHRLHDRTNAEIFQVLLPQLVFTRPCVSAAAAAVGAAYDMSVKRSTHTGVDLVLKLYITAIREIKEELQRKDLQLVPMLMAAFLLAAAESVQQQHNIAFNHIAGAFGMATVPSDRVSPHDAMRISQTFGFGALLSLFFSLDLQISHFTWGRLPGFPPMPIEDHMRNPTTLEHLLAAQPVLHQRCLHFIGNAAHSICIRSKCVLHKLDQEQSDLIAWLNRWLSAYNHIINHPEKTTSLSDFRHLQLLKAQTLTTLISTSNVKPLTQSSYDIYAPQFDEIISLADDILRYVATNPSTTPTSPSHTPASSSTTTTRNTSPSPPNETSVLTPVAAVPGIIHPLFYTARKYRQPTQRRRAIALLALAGIEGPLHGPCEALVASQIVALEEDGAFQPWRPVDSAMLSPYPHLRYATPSSPPPEARRVCVAWLVHQTGPMAGKGIWGSTFPGSSAPSSPPSPSTTTNTTSTSTSTPAPTGTAPAAPSPFWNGGDPQAPKRRWLRVSRRRRGPLGTGWGGEDVPGNFGDGGAGAPSGHVKGGGEIRMLDGDGIASWRELLGEGSWEDWEMRRGWGGVESLEL